MKQITFTESEVSGVAKYNCTYTETQGSFGMVNVSNAFTASHTQAIADANHTFSIDNGTLKVEIPGNNGSGSEYALAGNVLTVNNGFTGSITAMYEFTTSTVREIDFSYDHNGLRTQKKVVENGVTTTYDYTLHGKMITHLTKRTVDENGTESTEELHFFYDAQNKPAFVEYEGAMYRYVHNLQGDIVAIVDAAGNLVVEYKYDAWGKSIGTTGSLKTTLGEHNPFRYREYIYDNETMLYYLCTRYYSPDLGRFVNADAQFGGRSLLSANLYLYCLNNPTLYFDSDGCEPQIAPSPSRSKDWYEQFDWNYYFTSAGVYYRGEPNSHRVWQTPKGDWYERWYDEDGFPVMDRHWSDHSNPKDHPWVPHDEDWKDDGKGGKTLDRKSARPSPPDAQKPTKPTDSNKISINVKPRDAGKVVIFVFLVGAYIFSGGMTPVPTYA